MNHDHIVENFWPLLLKLQKSMPKIGLIALQNENSYFTSCTDKCKNCYMIINAWENEDCMYSRSVHLCKDCTDCDKITECTLCYQCLDCKNCYNCDHLQWGEDCVDCQWGYDLKGCRNCYGCIGLRRQEFCIFNQKKSQEEYESEIAHLRKYPDYVQQMLDWLKPQIPRLYGYNVNTENCTGDQIRNSKNVHASYMIEDCQDVLYSMECFGAHDLIDTEFCEHGSFNCDCMSAYHLHNSVYCNYCWESSDLEYCEHVIRSLHCFGSVFLNHKKYHILNKPYEPEEYFRLKEKIKNKIKEDGIYGRKFLPSTFPFEDTMAADNHF